MSRKTFEDLLGELQFDVETEFYTIWKMFYRPIEQEFSDKILYSLSSSISRGLSIWQLCSREFALYPKELRKTFRRLEEYECALGIRFSKLECKIDFGNYLLLCEYMATLAYGLGKSRAISELDLELLLSPLAEQIKDSLDWCGHKLILRNCTCCAVPIDASVIEAAKVVESSLANDIMYYGHRDMSGNINEKRNILERICRYLEGVRNDIEHSSSDIANALFNMANQLDVRHNNTSESSPKYKPFVAALSQGQLEHWYDNLFKICIAAIQLVNSKDAIEEYKDNQQSMNESCKKKKN